MRLVVLNGLLLALVGAAIFGVLVLDRSEASVEGVVRRYAEAVSTSDLDGALDEIAPDQRAAYREWVSTQLGNIYDVRGIAVRSPSMIDRVLRRAARGPSEVTVVLDINRGYADEFYQPTSDVPVVQVDGRWYLARPLLVR
jgi:hypothetical protein